MATERRVVDNRVFLLGLDKLYRDAMQEHERGELLRCARRVADVLHKGPADVPIEGYYANDAWLTEYFRLVRALQSLSEEVAPSVEALPEFQRLRAVTSSALFGRSVPNGNLLPRGRDPLSQALIDSNPWTMAGLTAAAYEIAVRTDDISLVGLAARVRDTVVLAATRESVVLYAEIIVTSALIRERPRYVWNVDEELARQARRFIDTFSTLLLGLALSNPLVSCAVEGQTPNRITRDAAALFQTDSLGYTLRAGDVGFDGEIRVTFTNSTSGIVFIVNCNGATATYLEKRVAGQWRRVWSPPIPLCLSPPITVPAGATYRTRLWIFGGYPGTNAFPQFSITDVAGEYRAGWGSVLSSYQNRPPFGDPLPIGQRVSNRFMLATERR